MECCVCGNEMSPRDVVAYRSRCEDCFARSPYIAGDIIYKNVLPPEEQERINSAPGILKPASPRPTSTNPHVMSGTTTRRRKVANEKG